MAVTRSTAATTSKRSVSTPKSSSKASTARNISSKQGVNDSMVTRLEQTSDGHYNIIYGRRWRATDPMIPDEIKKELLRYHAMGRSATGAAKRKGKTEADSAVKIARKRTGIAKHGLGERGQPPWWDDSDDHRRRRWEDALDELRQLDDTSVPS